MNLFEIDFYEEDYKRRNYAPGEYHDMETTYYKMPALS